MHELSAERIAYRGSVGWEALSEEGTGASINQSLLRGILRADSWRRDPFCAPGCRCCCTEGEQLACDGPVEGQPQHFG